MVSTVTLRPGLNSKVTLTVSRNDTALALRSGDVPVLATPRLIALCEEATCKALDGHLEQGSTSVAVRVQFDHLAPVGIGATVSAEVVLEKVDGRRLTFTASVSDSSGLVGAGKVTRVLVMRSRFLEKVR